MQQVDSVQDWYEANLDDLKSLQSVFIQNVEHELRTPLAVVQGYVELLRSGTLGELAPEQQMATTTIARHVNKLCTLVEQIGVLLEIETPTDVSMLIELVEVIADVVEARRGAAAQAGLRLETHLEPDLPLVPGNPRQLRQAFDCLLDNALKFTPRGGRVEVHTYAEPGWVCFAVDDTGVGIEEDKLIHLFNGFYQADGSTTRHHSGLGLGLTLVRAVVEAHGGQIEMQSQVGQGSRFSLKLPLLSLAAQKGFVPSPHTNGTHRILVVDDDESVTAILRAGLEKLPGIKVVVAASGEQALQLLEQRSFDLLITDYRMPGTDGMSLARHVRQAYPATPIIMLTAYNNEELREWATCASIQRILDKPVKLAEIRAEITKVLDKERETSLP